MGVEGVRRSWAVSGMPALALSLLAFAPAANTPISPQGGAVAQHSYQSQAIGGMEEYYVYTPPGYDAKRTEPFPVLYLLHGVDGDAHSWIADGAANRTLDRLIAAGKAKPMLLVMPLSFGAPDRRLRIENFGEALLREIVPRVSGAYNASTDRLGRGIAGLSMGGAEALLIGLNNVDRFAWVGAFSPAAAIMRTGSKWNIPSLGSEVNDHLKLLYITCGTKEPLINQLRQLRDVLTAAGVRTTFVEAPDAGHEWSLWKQNLAELAQLIFQDSGKSAIR
jgi:enterochelin esterase-like enzyme